MPTDLTEVIENAITDLEIPDEPIETPTPDEPVEPSSSTEVTPEPPAEPVVEGVVEPAVPSPTEPVKPLDDFEKRFGIPANSTSGRENRIPYSRVTKIVGKAQKEAEASVRKEFEPKVLEFETKAKDYEAKVKDYEGRLGQVAEFERVMLNEPDKFLDMLSATPAYKPFFARITQLLDLEQKASPTAPQAPSAPVPSDRPKPDQELPDGSKIYSEQGLEALLEWNANRAESRAIAKVTDEFTKRFGPIESEWQAHQKIQQTLPKVQAQINEARQWPQFNENETDIVAALKANSNLSLEGAYRQVVFPRMVADRGKMKQELMAEIKQAPRSTSTPVAPAKVATPVKSGKRDLETVIAESIQHLRD